MSPKMLYHGSMFRQDELMPSFKRTGKLVRWDQTENNQYLYATTDKEEAIGLGFSSAVEKVYRLDEYHSDDQGGISLKIPNKAVTLQNLMRLDVFLYTIAYRQSDGWVLNNNEYNNLKTEYKTQRTITVFEKLEKIDVRKWMKTKNIKLVNGKNTNLPGW